VRLVSAADKLHNLQTLLRDYRKDGEEVWDRFNANREQQLWFYHSVTDALRATGDHRALVDELDRTLLDVEHCCTPVEGPQPPSSV
jgi:GTP pyrophosphokinase